MNNLGITKGEWINEGLHFRAKGGNPIGQTFLMSFSHDRRGRSIKDKEGYENANLISDAGTTANKCGLLPSELLKQRNELLEVLELTKKSFENKIIDSVSGEDFAAGALISIINQAIQNTK